MDVLFCQVCGERNDAEREYCRRCHQKLMVISGPPSFDDLENFEGDDEPFSLDEHLLERISILEEVVKRQAETVRRTLETLYKLEQKILVNQTGVTTLRDLLEGKQLIAREEWSELWESRMDYHLLALEKRERFASVKGSMGALYRGEHPEEFRHRLDEAEIALLSLDIGGALGQLEEAHRLDPLNHELSYFLAETFFNEGRSARALEFFERVLTAKPRHFEALVLSGVLRHELGEDERAVEQLSEALGLEPQSFLATFALGAVLTAMRRFEIAVPLLARAVELDDLPQAHFLLARCHYELGRPGRAIRHLERGLLLDPDAAEAHELLGLACLDRHWVRKAERALHQAHRLRPAQMRSEELRHLLDLDPGIPSTPPAEEIWQRGDELRHRGRSREALSAYRRALAVEPDNPRLLLAYAMACLELGRGSEVEPVAVRLLGLEAGEPLMAGAYAVLIEALRGEGKLREGLQLARRFLDQAGSDSARSVAYYELAYNLAEMEQDLDQALSFARSSVDLASPDQRHLPFAALGWVHYKRRELDESIEYLDRARSLGPTPRNLTQLGLALLAAGNREQARRVLREARDLRRDEPDDRFIDVLKEGSRLLHDPPIDA